MFEARLRLARPRWSAAESVLYAGSRLRPVRAYARRRGLLLPDLAGLRVSPAGAAAPVDGPDPGSKASQGRDAPAPSRLRHLYAGRWLPGVPRGALSLSRLLRGPAPDPCAARPDLTDAGAVAAGGRGAAVAGGRPDAT